MKFTLYYVCNCMDSKRPSIHNVRAFVFYLFYFWLPTFFLCINRHDQLYIRISRATKVSNDLPSQLLFKPIKVSDWFPYVLLFALTTFSRHLICTHPYHLLNFTRLFFTAVFAIEFCSMIRTSNADRSKNIYCCTFFQYSFKSWWS